MNKKIIIGIIIGGIIFGSVGVYASTKLSTKDVSVAAPTGSNLESDATLQASLDELYSMADNNINYGDLGKRCESLGGGQVSTAPTPFTIKNMSKYNFIVLDFKIVLSTNQIVFNQVMLPYGFINMYIGTDYYHSPLTKYWNANYFIDTALIYNSNSQVTINYGGVGIKSLYFAVYGIM